MRLCNKLEKLKGATLAGLTSSVTESNHTGCSDHKFLPGYIIVGSHAPDLQLP